MPSLHRLLNMSFKPYFYLMVFNHSHPKGSIETIQSPRFYGVLSKNSENMHTLTDTLPSRIKQALRDQSDPLTVEAIVILDGIVNRKIEINKTILIHQKGFGSTKYTIVKVPVIDHESGKTTLYVKALSATP